MNANPTATTGLSEQQRLDTPASPKANDDLTIADHLRAWQQSCSEGETCFRDEAGETLRISEDAARDFVEEHGALHPGDYESKYQRDWREDFAALQAHD